MNKLAKTFLFYSQRMIKSYKLRQFITRVEGKIIGKTKIEGTSFLVPANNEKTHLDELINNGYSEFEEKIPEESIDKIISETSDFKLFDPFNTAFGEFKKEDVNVKTHVANFKRSDLVTCPEILKIANDPGILRIVQEFLGAKPTISNINMWWSLSGKEKAKDAQLFHRDVDDIKFCKLFIYLTDVGPNDGPHTYVKGSSNSNRLTIIRRYEDKEVTSVFGEENVMFFTRPKGSYFLVDTYGFHKGTLPMDNDRLLLQVQYSINPIGIENYAPIENSHNYDKYTNRLILKK